MHTKICPLYEETVEPPKVGAEISESEKKNIMNECGQKHCCRTLKISIFWRNRSEV